MNQGAFFTANANDAIQNVHLIHEKQQILKMLNPIQPVFPLKHSNHQIRFLSVTLMCDFRLSNNPVTLGVSKLLHECCQPGLESSVVYITKNTSLGQMTLESHQITRKV